MKITDVTLTLFSWESIPSTIYGHHTARPTGKSDLGLLRIVTDEGVEGNAFLGTSSNPASLDGPGLVRFLKPILIDPVVFSAQISPSFDVSLMTPVRLRPASARSSRSAVSFSPKIADPIAHPAGNPSTMTR